MEYGTYDYGAKKESNGYNFQGMQPLELRKPNNMRKKKGLIVGIFIVAVIALIYIFIINSDEHKQKSIEGTLSLFFEAIEENDYEKYLTLVPDYWKDYLRASKDTILEHNFKEHVSEHDSSDKLEFDITYQKELKPSKYSNMKHGYDIDGKIESYVYVDLKVENEHGDKWTYSDFGLIKIDGKWYLAFGYVY